MNLLIVDDEPLIHVSIEFSLEELQTDDVQIFHAYSGTEMLTRMAEQAIDIALVDIQMPGMSGLEAINAAREQWPNTFYYIMSGFSEFEYAREAIRLNVTEYLLKPLEPEALAAVIAKVRAERANQQEQVRDAFRAWLEGTLHRHDVGYLYSPQYYTAILLLTYDSNLEDQDPWVPDAVLTHHEYFVSIPCNEGVLLMLFAPSAPLGREILREVRRRNFPEGVTCFATSMCHDAEKMATQMRQILDYSPIRVYRGIGVRYDVAAILSASEEEIGAAQKWIALRDSFFTSRYTDYVSLGSQLAHSQDMWPAQGAEQLEKFLETVTGIPCPGPKTAEEKLKYLRQAGETLMQQRKNTDKLDSVLSYVERNFNKDISVASLAARFDLTPNYLSALLKKKLGMKFTDYLTRLRIAQAKRLLLSTDLSIKEITEQVGYYSQSHFTKLFMEREGCTPGEFRANNE